ncbi:putative RuvC-like Holliday junction resolvase [Crocosphaera subtropica ATCC 51142]|uniref:RuvC-like Holliday junction resolvase n=2 Tax=Crocosphaera TaxID=263510 RepID=B1X347_CROS5|nr:putative RuvC-like Holliday junction resolvase [Crocosphaera subtropica ATCC 51142]
MYTPNMAIQNARYKNLIRQKPNWNHLPTKPIRVPECFIEEITTYARSLDYNPNHNTQIPRWLGIKPSISNLGWAVIEGEPTEEPNMVDFGLIETDSHDPLPYRLGEIETDLREILVEYQPNHIAIEQPFIKAEYPSTTKLLQVLGVVNLVAYRHGCLPTMIYPATWKSNLDHPKAEREDLSAIVEELFDLQSILLNQEVDAIAVAYTAWCGLGIQP